MKTITIIACDRDTSKTISNTFNLENLSEGINSWNIPFRKYYLITDEIIETLPEKIQNELDEFEVTN